MLSFSVRAIGIQVICCRVSACDPVSGQNIEVVQLRDGGGQRHSGPGRGCPALNGPEDLSKTRDTAEIPAWARRWQRWGGGGAEQLTFSLEDSPMVNTSPGFCCSCAVPRQLDLLMEILPVPSENALVTHLMTG